MLRLNPHARLHKIFHRFSFLCVYCILLYDYRLVCVWYRE